MYWAIFGIFHSIFRAVFVEVNRIYRADPWQTAFLHAGVAVVLLLPFVAFMDWPADLNFYLAAVMVALILSVGVVIQLNLSAERKGRVSSISISLEAITAALVWIAIMPYMLHYYLNDMVMTLGVVSAFALAFAALFFLRPTDFSWQAFVVVAPVGVTYAVAGVVTKLVIPSAHLIPAALSFVFMNYIVMTIVMGFFLLLKGKAGASLWTRSTIKAGALTGLFAALAYLTFVVSVVFAPNPGYTSLLAVLVPVWLMWYHELRLVEDRANPLAAVLIVASIVLLIIST